MQRASYACTLLGTVALFCVAVPLRASDAPVKVIAHPSRTAAVTRAELRAIYLKQKLFWGDGRPIVPVNREAGSRDREVFSQRVFGQDSRRLAAY